MQDLTPRLMSGPQTSPLREQSRDEELANSLSHGAGLVAALLASPPLIVHAVELGNVRFLVGASIFAVTMVLLYLASTVYHALPSGRAKQVIRVIEHSAIFLLIAGTYTPFTLGVLHGTLGWTLFGLIWGLATIGVMLKVVNGTSHPIASTILYLLMGWIILIAIDPMFTLLPAAGLFWLIAGGLAYTAGVLFFIADSRLRYGHFIWHLFVMTGTTCHYFAIFWYAA
jgi:hemolysin III